jgi:hypothetical protein
MNQKYYYEVLEQTAATQGASSFRLAKLNIVDQGQTPPLPELPKPGTMIRLQTTGGKIADFIVKNVRHGIDMHNGTTPTLILAETAHPFGSV